MLVEPLEQGAGLALGRRQCAHELALLEEGGLEHERLLPPQRLARLLDLVLEAGTMDPLEGGARVEQTVAHSHGLGQRVVDGTEAVEHDLDELRELPARDRAGRRIDRDGQIRVGLGVEPRGVFVVEELVVRVRELLRAPVLADLAGEDAAATGLQIFAAPGLIEEGQREVALAVADDDLEDGALAVLHAPLGGTAHFGHDRDRLADRQATRSASVRRGGRTGAGSATAGRRPSSCRRRARGPPPSCPPLRRRGANRGCDRPCVHSRHGPDARFVGWQRDAHHRRTCRRHDPRGSGAGTRPTSDRVRESLFGALESAEALRGARVVDLYAGLGSPRARGDQPGSGIRRPRRASGPGRDDRAAQRRARRQGDRAGCPDPRAPRSGLRVPRSRAGPFDLAFLDPPYDLSDADLTADLAALRPLLTEHAIVIVERGRRSPAPALGRRRARGAPRSHLRRHHDVVGSAPRRVPVGVGVPAAASRRRLVADEHRRAPGRLDAPDRAEAFGKARSRRERREQTVVLSAAECRLRADRVRRRRRS